MAVGRDLSLANRLIAALPAIERALFIEHCELVELRLGALADQAVFRQRSAYFPIDGFIGVVVYAGGMPEAQAALVGNEGMFPMALVLGVTDGGFGFRVQGAGRAFRIDHGALRLLLGENESLLKVLSRYVAACQLQLALQAVCLHHHTVGQRLARWLLMTRDRAHSIELFLTHPVLARMVGARRESVSRAASMLEQRGLISYRHGYVMLVDEAGLEKTSCACYRASLLAYEQRLGFAGTPREAHPVLIRVGR